MGQSNSSIRCDYCTRGLSNTSGSVRALTIVDSNHNLGTWFTEYINKIIGSIDEHEDSEYYTIRFTSKGEQICKYICSRCYYKISRVVEEKPKQQQIESDSETDKARTTDAQSKITDQGTVKDEQAQTGTTTKEDNQGEGDKVTSKLSERSDKLSPREYVERVSRSRERSSHSTFSNQSLTQTSVTSVASVEGPHASVSDESDIRMSESTGSGTQLVKESEATGNINQGDRPITEVSTENMPSSETEEGRRPSIRFPSISSVKQALQDTFHMHLPRRWTAHEVPDETSKATVADSAKEKERKPHGSRIRFPKISTLKHTLRNSFQSLRRTTEESEGASASSNTTEESTKSGRQTLNHITSLLHLPFQKKSEDVDPNAVAKENVYDIISNLEAADSLARDRQWLMEAQTYLLNDYSQSNSLSDMQLQILLDTVSSIASSLIDIEFFKLTKALFSLVSEKHSETTSSEPLIFAFLGQLMHFYCISHDYPKGPCTASCLKMVFQCEEGPFHDSDLVRMVPTFTQAATWCVSSVISPFTTMPAVNLQQLKEILHLIQAYQIPMSTVQICLENPRPEQITDALHEFKRSTTAKGLQQVMTELSQSNLLDENMLKIVEQCLSSDTLYSTECYVNVAETEEAMNFIAKIQEPMLSQIFAAALGYPSNALCRTEDVNVVMTTIDHDLEAVRNPSILMAPALIHNIIVVLRNLSNAVKICWGFTPEITQLASLCILILSDKQKKNRLLEVLTGEGKSCIIAMFATFLGLQGRPVDIVTSSRVLAERDAKKWSNFFQIFGLTTACNTESKELLSLKPSEADKKRCEVYKHNIVYGTVSSFSADILRDEFEMRHIRSGRGLQTAVVDEVDMLMLDEGVQFTYLSNRVAVMRHIEPILGMIWSSVRQHTPVLAEDGNILFTDIAKCFYDVIFGDVDTNESLSKLLQLVSVLPVGLGNTVRAIVGAEDIKSRNENLDQLETEDMLLLINVLNANETVHVKAYTFDDNGVVRRATEQLISEAQSQEPISVLLRDKGKLSQLHTQTELANGIENMMKSNCDTLHTKEHFRTTGETLYYLNGIAYLDQITYGCLDPLHVITILGNAQPDKAKLALEAKMVDEKTKAMEEFDTKHMLSLIHHINTSQVSKYHIVAYTLDEENKLRLWDESSGASESEDCQKIPVLVLAKGKLQPLYHQNNEPQPADLRTIDGAVYTPGQASFFSGILVQYLNPLQMMEKLGLLQNDKARRLMAAQDETERFRALQDMGSTDIIAYINTLNRSGASHHITAYVFNGEGNLHPITEGENPPSAISVLVVEEGRGRVWMLQSVQEKNASQEEILFTEDGGEYYRGAPNVPKEVLADYLDPLQVLHLMVKAEIAKGKIENVLDAEDQETRDKAMEGIEISDILQVLKYLEDQLPCMFPSYIVHPDCSQTLMALHDSTSPHYNSGDVHPFMVLDHGKICFLHKAQDEHAAAGLSTPDGTKLIPGPHEAFYNAILKCVDTAQLIQLLAKGEIYVTNYMLQVAKLVACFETQSVKRGSIVEYFPAFENIFRFKPIVYEVNGQRVYPDNNFVENILRHTNELTDDSKKKVTKPEMQLLLLENGKLCRLNVKEKVAIPSFLKDFVVNQLPTYIESAFTAHILTENREYLVSKDGKIHPIDFQNSGVIEENKRWGGGLQQMLEMKHHLHLTPINVITNFKSHVAFFRSYESLYGLSGTIGSDAECEVLKDLYKFHPSRIPTTYPRLLYEREPLLVEGERTNWLQKIHSVLEDVTSPKSLQTLQLPGAAALVLCEDIRTANEIGQFLKKKGQMPIFYTRSDSNSTELFSEDTKIYSGQIIIATNLAGRGTDIKVTDNVNHSGGLFCMVTFLPKNRRVELQAFGRTARQGSPGSVQYVLPSSALPLDYKSVPDMSSVREFREQVEAFRLRQMVRNDVQQVLLRETLFHKHCTFLKNFLDNNQSFMQAQHRQLVIDTVNEYWGQWLQMKQREVELQSESLLEELNALQSNLFPSLAQLLNSLLGNPCTPNLLAFNFHNLVRFGNHCLFGIHGTPVKEHAKEAYHFYTLAIQTESKFTMVAHYNRACCTLTTAEKHYIEESIADLKRAKELLEVYTKEVTYIHQCATLGGQRDVTKNNALLRQVEVRMQLLHHFEKKIEETVKKLEEMKKNGDDAEVKPTSILQFIPEADIVTNDELYGLKLLGLEISFTVEKKPKFSWWALAVFLLGIVEIVAGACISVLTAGALSSVGMGLISEGVSDCMDGAWGMISGDFDLKDWSISKACSIGLSIACGGVGKYIARGAKTAVKAAKSAEGFRSGVKAFAKSALETAEEGGRIIANDVKAMGNVTKDSAGKVLVSTMKDTGYLIGKEIMSQGAVFLLSKLENLAIEEIFEQVGQFVASKVESKLRQSLCASGEGDLGRIVDAKFVSEDHVKSPILEKDAFMEFDSIVDEVLSSLVHDHSTVIDEVTTTFRDKILPVLSAHLKGKAAVFASVLTLSFVTDSISETVVQLSCLSTGFEPEMVKHCKARFHGIDDQRDYQAIDALAHVKKLKEDLAKHTTQTFSKAVANILQQNLSWMLNHGLSKTVNKLATHYVNKTFDTEGTIEQITAAQSANYLRSMPLTEHSLMHVNHEEVKSVMKSCANSVLNHNSLGSLAEIRVAAEKYGCKIAIVDEHENRKCSLHSTSSRKAEQDAPEIILVHRSPSLKYPDGHYDVMINGKVVEVHSQGNSCMYEAFAVGLNKVKEGEPVDAQIVRQTVSDEISTHPELWYDHFKRREHLEQVQNGHEHLLKGAARTDASTKILQGSYEATLQGRVHRIKYKHQNRIKVKSTIKYKGRPVFTSGEVTKHEQPMRKVDPNLIKHGFNRGYSYRLHIPTWSRTFSNIPITLSGEILSGR